MKKEAWFVITRSRRLVAVHWKGWASFLVLCGLAVSGAELDDRLRTSASLPLYILGMAPLCVAVLALTWVIACRIERKG